MQEMEAMESMREFMTRYEIAMMASHAKENPHLDVDPRDTWAADHWKVVFRMGPKRFTTYFSLGPGHNGRMPEGSEVLDCLASDAAMMENAFGFEEWASELGYDPDSRRAERVYGNVKRQTARLKTFLGEEAYDNLLWHTERE